MRPLKPLRKLPGLQPRRGGERVYYSAAQTERYKDPERRRERALELLQQWTKVVRENAIDANRTLYYFNSTRSPFGYWTVGVVRSPSDPSLPEPLLPELPPDPPGGGGGGGGGGLSNVYVMHRDPLGASVPGFPARFTAGVTNLYYGALAWKYPVNEVAGGSLVVIGIGSPVIFSVNDLGGSTLAAAQATEEIVWFRHSKLYMWNGESYILFYLYRFSGPEPLPPEYDDQVFWDYNPLPGLLTDVLSSRPKDTTPSDTAIPIAGGGNGGGPGDPTPPPDLVPPPLEPPPDFEFSCDCPDSIRYEYADAESPYPSRWQAREWVESEAGAIEGVCKHIMAVRLKLGLTAY